MDTLNEKEIRVLRYLIETAYKIRDSHKKGNIYFEKELSMTAYGWHNIKFPPEYREYTLTKRRGRPICKEYDYYYLFMEVSELIYEDSSPLNRVLRSEVGKKRLKKSLAGWDDEVIRTLFLLIKKGISKKPEDRISNYEELAQMSEWSLVQKRYVQYCAKPHRDGGMNSCQNLYI